MQRVITSSILIFCAYPVYASEPEVETSNGRIRGFDQSFDGSIVHTYYSIPYAEPPIGNLRFKRPIPIRNWTQVLNATQKGASCFQMPFESFQDSEGKESENMWNPNTQMSEDCLYVNIWVPESLAGRTLSTMVWIYGGGFVTGTSTLDIYDGTILAAMNSVIVVSINYRLGPLGFLYLDHEMAPGNMGLLDQNLALKWIHSNIEHFGGSPGDITLFGESAGSASISYHLISPMSQNLFQRGILQSGSALAHWAYQDPSIAKEYALLLAAKFGCDRESVKEMVECLQTKSANTLSYELWNLPITNIYFNFVPTNDNFFITSSPQEYYRSGNFPRKSFLFGVNSNEATYFLIYALKDKLNWPGNGLNRTEFLEAVPNSVSPNGLEKLDATRDRIIIDAMLHTYQSGVLPGDPEDYMKILDAMSGDFAFRCPVINVAQELATKYKGSPSVYMYLFEQRPSVSYWPQWTGVLHGDEIEFIFGKPLRTNSNYTANEQQLSGDMMKYWTEFAKSGRPSFDWPEYSDRFEEYKILKADYGTYSVGYGKGLLHSQCIFWSQYIPKLQESISILQDDAGDCINNSNYIRGSVLISMMSILYIFLACCWS